MKNSAIRTVCVAVIAMSFLAACLVFHGVSAAATKGTPDGAKLYANHCGGCHPNGGNVITPALPVIGSPKLKDRDTFLKFNRNPLKADGSKGAMPAFTKEVISDQDMNRIYQYTVKMRPAKK